MQMLPPVHAEWSGKKDTGCFVVYIGVVPVRSLSPQCSESTGARDSNVKHWKGTYPHRCKDPPSSVLSEHPERDTRLSLIPALVLRSVSRCSCVVRGDTLTAEYTHLQLSLIASARAVVWCAETLTPSVSRALRAPKRETWALENTEHRKGEHPHRCMNQLSPVLSEHPEGDSLKIQMLHLQVSA